jgi:hypothetical protein
MSIEYHIDTQEGIIYERFIGIITPDDVIEHIKRQRQDALFNPIFSSLTDLTQAIGINWDYLQTARFRNFAKEICTVEGYRLRWALIVSANSEKSILNVLMLLNEALDVKIDIKVFENTEPAKAWIKGGV